MTNVLFSKVAGKTFALLRAKRETILFARKVLGANKRASFDSVAHGLWNWVYICIVSVHSLYQLALWKGRKLSSKARPVPLANLGQGVGWCRALSPEVTCHSKQCYVPCVWTLWCMTSSTFWSWVLARIGVNNVQLEIWALSVLRSNAVLGRCHRECAMCALHLSAQYGQKWWRALQPFIKCSIIVTGNRLFTAWTFAHWMSSN